MSKNLGKVRGNKTGPVVTTGKTSAAAKVLGTTKDGVRILKPKGGATHFTSKELRDAVNSARLTQRA